MCLLCDDERAYQAYMNYLDAMARQGMAADPDQAVNAVLDELQAKDQGVDPLGRSRGEPAHQRHQLAGLVQGELALFGRDRRQPHDAICIDPTGA